ncbi:MAG: UvrB/UvrC motif-containing protein [Tissierellia bacterium]|nr:UvrB/UvrC motif-containing protein [Tissierellia bacterium]
MLCEDCHEREAILTYSFLDGEERVERHICQACMEKYLVETFPFSLVQDQGLESLVGHIFSLLLKEEDGAEEDLSCSHCQTSLEEFKRTSLLGCSHCYETFSGALDKMIPQIQGADYHVGLRPQDKNQDLIKEIKALEAQLEEAVLEERYEDAAVYRDQIQVLREALGEGI